MLATTVGPISAGEPGLSLDDAGAFHPLICAFADNPLFASAKVEELVLEDDFYRRPLRPEDLKSIDFVAPITDRTVTSLPSLAAQRLLLCAHETDITLWPSVDSSGRDRQFENFHGAGNVTRANAVREFLTRFALGFFSDAAVEQRGLRRQCVEDLDECSAEADTFWNATFAGLSRAGYLDEGLRFLLIQHLGLADSKRAAIQRSIACGDFDAIEPEHRPRAFESRLEECSLSDLAAALELTRKPHSYWQFYLPTSLAVANQVHRFASIGHEPLGTLGVAFAVEAEHRAFYRAVMTLNRTSNADRFSTSRDSTSQDLTARCGNAAAAIEARHGRLGVEQFARGLLSTIRIGRCWRADQRTQLQWACQLERFSRIARAFGARIRQECPGLPMDTFDEPREMCSTTHVHDDQRLVIVESGQMVFWCNVGMRVSMGPGDMLFVPQGRLHGSAVESRSCRYHQPILPEAWVSAIDPPLDSTSW